LGVGRGWGSAGEVGGKGVDAEFAGEVDACDADVGAERGVGFDGLLDEGVGGAILGGSVEGLLGAVAEVDAEGLSVDVVRDGMEDDVIVGVGLEGGGDAGRKVVLCHDAFTFRWFEMRGQK
jgi:hypothetical protein